MNIIIIAPNRDESSGFWSVASEAPILSLPHCVIRGILYQLPQRFSGDRAYLYCGLHGAATITTSAHSGLQVVTCLISRTWQGRFNAVPNIEFLLYHGSFEISDTCVRRNLRTLTTPKARMRPP